MFLLFNSILCLLQLSLQCSGVGNQLRIRGLQMCHLFIRFPHGKFLLRPYLLEPFSRQCLLQLVQLLPLNVRPFKCFFKILVCLDDYFICFIEVFPCLLKFLLQTQRLVLLLLELLPQLLLLSFSLILRFLHLAIEVFLLAGEGSYFRLYLL